MRLPLCKPYRRHETLKLTILYSRKSSPSTFTDITSLNLKDYLHKKDTLTTFKLFYDTLHILYKNNAFTFPTAT
jgi:hypothetical protein